MAKRSKQRCPFYGKYSPGLRGQGKDRSKSCLTSAKSYLISWTQFSTLVPRFHPGCPPSPRPPELIPLAAPPPRTEHPHRHLIYHCLTSNPGSSPLGHSVTFISALKTREGHCWQKSRRNEFYVLETEKLNYFHLKVRAGRKSTKPNPLGGKNNKTKQAG